eukprot:10868665-Alexandrium_andersonii.AAC.1
MLGRGGQGARARSCLPAVTDTGACACTCTRGSVRACTSTPASARVPAHAHLHRCCTLSQE